MAGATHHVRIDRSKTLAEEPSTGHNRWHEAIPPIVTVAPGDRVVLETRDALDGQFSLASTIEDVGHADLMPGPSLTGPVAVEGAEPGDLLEVRIEEIRPEPFGFTSPDARLRLLARCLHPAAHRPLEDRRRLGHLATICRACGFRARRSWA